MEVRVRLFAAFRERVGTGELRLAMPEGTTAGDVLQRLVAEHPAIAGLAGSVQYAVDREFVPAGFPLRDGSEVSFIPPVSGGADA